MLVYHGSNMAVTRPRLMKQTRGLDFGMGFYLTTSETQAIRFSEIVVKRNNSGIATVSVYELDMDYAQKTLDICKFSRADETWLDFVVKNRMNTYSGKDYDVVIGAVANDKVMPTIQALIGGFLNTEAALTTLKTSVLVDQLCLKTEKAISLLKFIKAYTTQDERNGHTYG